MSAPMSDSRIVSRSLAQRRLSTAITVATVAVAVALMLSLLGLRDSARTVFGRGTGNMHLLVSNESSPMVSVLNSVFYANAPGGWIDWNQFNAMTARMPMTFKIPTQLGDSYRGLPVMATTAEFFTQFEPALGEPWVFAEGGVFEDTFDVVVGAGAAARLGLSVGDTLQITHGFSGAGADHAGHTHDEYTWTVRGVLEPSGTLHDAVVYQTIEATWIIHAHDRIAAGDPHAPLTTFEDLTPNDMKVTGVYIQVASRPGRDASAAVGQVATQLRQMPRTTVADPGHEVLDLFQMFSNVEVVLITMAGVVLISSGLGIFLALYNSMEQRRRQIAVLRVLGSSRGRVLRLVLYESLVIGLLGVVVGWFLTVGGSALVAEFLRERLGFGVRPVLEPALIAMVSLGALALALLAGLIPALRAYRVAVVRNLRPIG